MPSTLPHGCITIGWPHEKPARLVVDRMANALALDNPDLSQRGVLEGKVLDEELHIGELVDPLSRRLLHEQLHVVHSVNLKGRQGMPGSHLPKKGGPEATQHNGHSILLALLSILLELWRWEPLPTFCVSRILVKLFCPLPAQGPLKHLGACAPMPPALGTTPVLGIALSPRANHVIHLLFCFRALARGKLTNADDTISPNKVQQGLETTMPMKEGPAAAEVQWICPSHKRRRICKADIPALCASQAHPMCY